MAINPLLLDQYIAHRTFLVRHENAIVGDVLKILLRGEEQAIGAIASSYSNALAKVGGDATKLKFSGHGVGFRRNALRRSRAALSDVFPEARTGIAKALGALSNEENRLLASALEETLPKAVFDELALSKVPEQHLANLVEGKHAERLTGSAKGIFDDFAKIESDALARIQRTLEDGIRDGDGMAKMVRNAQKAMGSVDGITGKNVAGYVRTMVQSVSSDVAGELYRSNQDVIRAEQYHATLDDQTCTICGPLDGKVFPFRDGKSTIPRPPRHVNCRCFASPVVKGWKQLGLPDTLNKKAKRLLDGKPAERTVWSDWVRAKPGRLEEVLGPSRAKGVKNGTFKLSDLATTSEVRNLDELAALRKKAA